MAALSKAFPAASLQTKGSHGKQLFCESCLKTERYLQRVELPDLDSEDRDALFSKSAELQKEASPWRGRSGSW